MNAPVMKLARSLARNATTWATSSSVPRRASAKAIAAAHGLREVTAWPIGLLEVHCLVYELPEGVDRNAMLEQLRRDRRVETAQPLQTFSTLTSYPGVPSSVQLARSAVMRVAPAMPTFQ